MKLYLATKSDFPLIKELYLEAFPKMERRPFWTLIRSYKKGKMEILVLKDLNGRFLGFAITVEKNDLVMLDYLAVCPQARGTGAGTAILEKIRERYAGKRIFLLIEELHASAINIEQRIKRKRFYLRNGYIDTGIRTSSMGGNMEILSTGGTVTGEDYLFIQRYNIGRLFMLLGRIDVLA